VGTTANGVEGLPLEECPFPAVPPPRLSRASLGLGLGPGVGVRTQTRSGRVFGKCLLHFVHSLYLFGPVHD
jgi:hypothetical protein